MKKQEKIDEEKRKKKQIILDISKTKIFFNNQQKP